MAAKLDVVKGDGPAPRSMADILADEMGASVEPRFVGVPATVAAVKRAPRTAPIKSMEGLIPLWFLIAPGDAGKTKLARIIAGKMVELYPESLQRNVLVATDPGPRLLPEFFAQVMQPPSADPRAMGIWLRQLCERLIAKRVGGVVDCGAEALALGELLRVVPNLVEIFRDAGIGLVGAYAFTPAVDDVALLAHHAEIGFLPDFTLLVLNLGRAESAAAFDALRRTPPYQAALARGAVEFWMPKLEPQELAMEIESARVLFHEARDGIVPAGNAHPPLSGMKRGIVRNFLRVTDEELAPIEAAAWMPWSA